MKEELKQLLKLYFTKRVVAFALTGLINTLTMIPIMVALKHALPVLAAQWIVIQLSIFTDFLWKNYVVFRGVKATGSKWHFEWTALSGVLVQDALVPVLDKYMMYIIAYLTAVAVGFIVRYGLTRWFIWRRE